MIGLWCIYERVRLGGVLFLWGDSLASENRANVFSGEIVLWLSCSEQTCTDRFMSQHPPTLEVKAVIWELPCVICYMICCIILKSCFINICTAMMLNQCLLVDNRQLTLIYHICICINIFDVLANLKNIYIINLFVLKKLVEEKLFSNSSKINHSV